MKKILFLEYKFGGYDYKSLVETGATGLIVPLDSLNQKRWKALTDLGLEISLSITSFKNGDCPFSGHARERLHRKINQAYNFKVKEVWLDHFRFEGRWADYDIPRTPKNIYWPKGLQQQEHPESVCRATMIRTLEHKLIRRPAGLSELYDLKNDPRELKNVYHDPRYEAVRADLESRLLDWYVHTSDVVPKDENPRGLPPR